jgi:hypothetical protein
VTVRVRESTGARGVIKAGLKASKFAPGVTALLHLIDERIPVLDPNTLMQKWVERRIGAGVERAIRWLDANFPPPGVFAPENSTLRARSEAATGELVAKGNVWRAQIKPGSQYGFQAHEDAEKSIAKNLDAVDRYSRHLADRVSKLAVKRDELHPITNNVEPYISALDTLANELEHKVELAAAMPGGYYMALELFSLAQFVRGVSKLVGQITTFIDQKDRDYRQAIDTAHKTLDQLERVEDEWSQVLMSAQQAAGL